MTPPRNRATRSRQQAGLSIGQAARLIPVDRAELVRIETDDDTFVRAGALLVRMAEVYHVDPAWMSGERELHDYTAVDGMRGAEDLTAHDRDMIAEFAASLPRGNETRSREILACKRAMAMATNDGGNDDGND